MVLQEAHRDARREGTEHAVPGPAVADFDPARGRIAEPGEESAQTAPEDHDRPRALPVLRFKRRVEGTAVVIFEQRVAHGDGDLARNLSLGFEGRGAQVRREHEVGRSAERAVDRKRFRLVYVQPGCPQLSGRESVRQGGLVDEPAARRVDEDHARPHRRDLIATDDPAVLVGERDVQGDRVACAEHRIEIDEFDAQVVGTLVVHERIVSDHAHPERPAAPGDFRADPARDR